MAIKKPWVEAYRPHLIKDIIFGSERVRRIFEGYAEAKEFPSLLIHGPKGTGKSSLSMALTHEAGVDEMDRLKINCSDEKIDALRDKVKSFATTMPYGDFKVVRLEEIDYLSLDGQALLRDLIETTSGTCRFIGTCNYLNKVIPPLQDRFILHHFGAPNRDEMLLRAAEILEAKNIEFTLEDLEAVVAAAYPSMRQVLQLLEGHSTSGTLLLGGGESASADWKLGLLPLLEAGDLKGARKLVSESATREELVDVFRYLYDNLHKVKTLKTKQDQAVVLIAQYQYQHAFVADGEINIAALFIELGAL
jgi:DNA polymerase III delta prime subunit